MTPQSQAIRRFPRARLPRATPTVLRSQDGSRRRGELKIVSLTGGLVCLSKTLDCRSRVRLVFATQAGTIHGSAEMLEPVSRDLQPFRFVELDGGDQRRLRSAIQSYLSQSRVAEESVGKYRTRLAHGTFFGDLLGYDPAGDDLLGVNGDPERNCPVCGIAGHNHTPRMTLQCGSQLLCGDDQTGKASEPGSNSGSRTSPNRSRPM
jgi:hypothetical protein